MRSARWCTTVLLLAGCASDRVETPPVATESVWPANALSGVLPAAFDSVRVICGGAAEPCPFKAAYLVSISADDAILVSDVRQGLHRYTDAEGWKPVGRQGAGPGEFMVPIAAAFSADGQLRIFDAALSRVTTIDAALNVVATTPLAAVPGIEDGKIDSDAVYGLFTRAGATEGSGRRIIARLEPDGDPRPLIDVPMADYEAASAGRDMRPVPPLFAARFVWTVSGSQLYAATGADDRVIIADSTGTLRTVVTGVVAEPVTEAQREERRTAISSTATGTMGRMVAAARAQADAVTIAEHPRFTAIVPIREGGVLVRGARIPGATSQPWYMVLPDGSAGAVFSLPDEDRIVAAAGEWALVVREGGDGVKLEWRRWRKA